MGWGVMLRATFDMQLKADGCWQYSDSMVSEAWMHCRSYQRLQAVSPPLSLGARVIMLRPGWRN